VDGDGYTDETVKFLAQRTTALAYIAGVSDSPPDAPVSSLQTFSANDLHLMPDTSAPLVVRDLTDALRAGEAKLWLLRYYGDGDPCVFFGKNGRTQITVSDLDRQKSYSYNSYAFIPPPPEFNKSRYGYADLLRVMHRLCAPDGCPWDRAQTHASIAKNALEEANELVEAIRLNDIENMAEEAGDVLLQGVFHGIIGERYGEFTPDDVVDGLCKKLVSRHTHVFGADKAADPDAALAFWRAAKAKEKGGE
jgi:uncharacterized protein YabN with tetrapyrrole methylase and pyrophosphatase domain